MAIGAATVQNLGILAAASKRLSDALQVAEYMNAPDADLYKIRRAKEEVDDAFEGAVLLYLVTV